MSFKILLLTAILLLTGCGTRESRKSLDRVEAQYILTKIIEVQYDGCTYLVIYPDRYSAMFTHKGNCKNHKRGEK